MKLEQMLAKLEQIERLALDTVDQHPRLDIERQKLIAAIARQLRDHIQDQLQSGSREPLAQRERRRESRRAADHL